MRTVAYCEDPKCKEKRLPLPAAILFNSIGCLVVSLVICIRQYTRITGWFAILPFAPNIHIYVMAAFILLVLALSVLICFYERFDTWKSALFFGATLPGTGMAFAVMLAGD